jgi:signal peptidase II
MTRTSAPLSRILLFAVLAIGACAIDLATKSWIFHRLGMPFESPPIVLVPGVFSLTTSLNEGALFGMGQGMTPVFAALSLFAAAGIIYWLFIAGAARDLWLVGALAAITAGILGNLYDRLGLPGLIWPNRPEVFARAGQPVYAVRDWLHFEIRRIDFDWAVFNIADSLLVVGAFMLFWHVAWRERNQHRSVGESTPAMTQSPTQ